jgi:hypothetical protein
MSKLLYGSINYDELLNQIKTGKINTSIVTRQNGETFRSVGINVWVNDEEDQYGNVAGVQLQLKKEARETGEKAPYIGNLKLHSPKVKEATANDFQDEDDDLPF